MTDTKGLQALSDFEAAACAALPAQTWGYYRSGADEESTLAENPDAWQRLRILPKVLVDVAQRSSATTVLGQPWSAPLAIAPTAFHGLAHPEKELATVRAAGAMGLPMILSTMSNTAVEEVVAAASAPVWFQLYVSRDRAASDDMVARVEAAGCQALVVTTDVPVLGRRRADEHVGFHLPDHLELPNMHGQTAMLKADPPRGHSAVADFTRRTLDPSLTFADIARFASRTRLPVVVKGVMRIDDARRALDHGAQAIVVSNHGGRQLDTVPATAEVVGEIAAAVGDRCEVLVDGGIRRGTDVFKALALGARAVLVGRPVLWGLAVDGEAGARRVLEILCDEFDRTLALTGCASVEDIRRDQVRG